MFCNRVLFLLLGVASVALSPCSALIHAQVVAPQSNQSKSNGTDDASTGYAKEVIDDLPKPFATKSSVRQPKVIGWEENQTPTAPDGFSVKSFGESIDNPRWIYQLPNGDILVSQSRGLGKKQKANYSQAVELKRAKREKAVNAGGVAPDSTAQGIDSSLSEGDASNQIMLLRDADHDGKPEVRKPFFKGLTQPFGMALVDRTFFIAATDGVFAFDYKEGQESLEGPGRKIMDLPAGGYNNHWTRNLLATPDGKHLLISVGSGSNIGEHGMQVEMLRACILKVRTDGTDLETFAGGLRNPVGMDFHPESGELWTVVNERDKLGDDLVPDYLTHVQEDGFYGWPWYYMGDKEDPRLAGERPELQSVSLAPDVPLGSHTASLGLAFYDGKMFPQRYRSGAFIGQRGSWNRSELAGYRITFVPMKDGKPAGEPEPFLEGFIKSQDEVHGRPVGVAVLQDGSLLVADERGNRLWRVSVDGE